MVPSPWPVEVHNQLTNQPTNPPTHPPRPPPNIYPVCRHRKTAAHPNIIKLIAVSEKIIAVGKKTDPKWAFVLELAQRGNLLKVLEQQQQLSLASKWHIAMQIADAMKYLHHSQEQPIIHRGTSPSPTTTTTPPTTTTYHHGPF